MKVVNRIEDAKRYLENAKTILSEKAKKDGDYYTDKKYVRMAGNTAWNGVLVALEGIFPKIKSNRVNFDYYKYEIGKMDRKMLNHVDSCYNHLHLSAGYVGDLRVETMKIGLQIADIILSWAAQKLPKTDKYLQQVA